MAKAKRKTCLHDNHVIYARGLCWGCFNRHQVAVKAGNITDDEAVERGLILPKKKQGRKPAGAGYEKALSKSQK